jgi:hypothetical protein
MRTTLEIDDDLVLVAKQLANQRKVTVGQVVSELMRKGLTPADSPAVRNGVPLFTPVRGAALPDLTLVNRLRDGE